MLGACRLIDRARRRRRAWIVPAQDLIQSTQCDLGRRAPMTEFDGVVLAVLGSMMEVVMVVMRLEGG